MTKDTTPKSKARKSKARKSKAPKKPVLKKPVLKKLSLSIHQECLWELSHIYIPIDHEFSNKVDDIKSILNAYIEFITKNRPLLAKLTIDINFFKKDNNLIVNLSFIDTEYFTINIGKYTGGRIYVSRKHEEYSHGGGKHIPLPDWYVSFLSVCECIYNDISGLFNE